MKALYFAMGAHAAVGQKRKYSNLPYYVHPYEVARLVYTHAAHFTREMVEAAYLHDVVEDTSVTLATIEDEFCPEVARLVAGMTKHNWPVPVKREARFEHEVARLASQCPKVKTIKLADSYANMLDYLKDDPAYAKKVYLPEKRILLDKALREGDATLWNMCDKLIKENL